MARRMTRPFMTGMPSSETATQPASYNSPISASSSPFDPLVIAPMGSTRAFFVRAAWARINSVTERESFTGRVFGIQHTVVNPPATAAALPEAIVSLYSKPGSRR